MKTISIRVVWGCMAVVVACSITAVASAQTRTLRIVTYNILADSGTYTTARPGLIRPSSGGSETNGGVLEGIGEEILAGNNQAIDILALQETTSNTTTVQPIVNGLNAFYGSRTNPAGYAMSTYPATSTGGTGGGPNAMVYNTNTLQLVASIGVGTAGGSSNGEYRQVVRYQFAPVGVATNSPNSTNTFYVYVSHYKASTGSANQTARAREAGTIRSNSAALPPDSRILYVGDYNASTSSEPCYQVIVAPGVNQGFDPINPSGTTGLNWGSTTTDTNILKVLTESSTNLRYRDDYHMMTSNVLYGVAGGLAYVSGTYHVFGINGTTAYNGNVNSGSDTALHNKLVTNVTGITEAQLYQYLTTASDHLPVVADYTIPIPSTSLAASFTGSPTNGVAPLSVTFSDTSTGSITNRFWDFGDGGTTNVTTNSVAHTYAAGTYDVMLVVWDTGGTSTNTKPSYITATTEPPVASFTGSPTSGTEPLAVTFTDTSTGSITSRFWDFGDGGTTNITTNSVVHTYAAGTNTVTLVVSGPGGISTNTEPGYITAFTTFQSWQIQHFGSINNPNAAPNADPDGDGISNLQEYLAGTDPANGASFFGIAAVTQEGSDVRITWTTVGGHTNIVQVTSGGADSSYGTNNFADILGSQTIVTGSSDATTNYLDAGATTNGPSRFYRVRLVP